MDKMCKECNEVLTKGLLGPDPFKGVYTVILNYNKKNLAEIKCHYPQKKQFR